MSTTIEQVREAEKRVQEILQELKKTGAADPENLQQQLRKASDEYAKTLRELSMN